MDQHGTEGQTHGRAGGVRDAQTGTGERPMIHFRKTVQIAPGRQADAVAHAHTNAVLYKEITGVTVRLSVVTTGTLGRLCFSADYENMAAREAAEAKSDADPRMIARMKEHSQMSRDGTHPMVPGTWHDEYWRDA